MTTDDTHLQERAVEKRDAITALEDARARIEQAGREPNCRERTFFKRALDLLNTGAYLSVGPEVEYMWEPPPKQGSKFQESADPAVERLDLAMMRRELAAAEATPVIPNPPPFPYVRT